MESAKQKRFTFDGYLEFTVCIYRQMVPSKARFYLKNVTFETFSIKIDPVFFSICQLST